MIEGIPFFGKEHNNIVEEIRSMSIDEHVKYGTMTELIDCELAKNVVVVIDNQWFSWLRDIQFNYRDRSAYLPYYTYELFDAELGDVKSDNKGHLLLNNETDRLYIRYNYELKLLPIDVETKLTFFDLAAHKKYSVSASNWYEATFDENELYIKYISSAYYDFDDLLEKHEGGYHYINRQFRGFRNVEWHRRKTLELPNFKEGSLKVHDFRDVRQYRKEELFGNTVREVIIPYKIRRLKFDCLLYCIIAQGSMPNNVEFKSRYMKLKEKPCILNYRPYYGAPALIFKSYWYGVGNYEEKRNIRQHV